MANSQEKIARRRELLLQKKALLEQELAPPSPPAQAGTSRNPLDVAGEIGTGLAAGASGFAKRFVPLGAAELIPGFTEGSKFLQEKAPVPFGLGEGAGFVSSITKGAPGQAYTGISNLLSKGGQALTKIPQVQKIAQKLPSIGQFAKTGIAGLGTEVFEAGGRDAIDVLQGKKGDRLENIDPFQTIFFSGALGIAGEKIGKFAAKRARGAQRRATPESPKDVEESLGLEISRAKGEAGNIPDPSNAQDLLDMGISGSRANIRAKIRTLRPKIEKSIDSLIKKADGLFFGKQIVKRGVKTPPVGFEGSQIMKSVRQEFNDELKQLKLANPPGAKSFEKRILETFSGKKFNLQDLNILKKGLTKKIKDAQFSSDANLGPSLSADKMMAKAIRRFLEEATDAAGGTPGQLAKLNRQHGSLIGAKANLDKFPAKGLLQRFGGLGLGSVGGGIGFGAGVALDLPFEEQIALGAGIGGITALATSPTVSSNLGKLINEVRKGTPDDILSRFFSAKEGQK